MHNVVITRARTVVQIICGSVSADGLLENCRANCGKMRYNGTIAPARLKMSTLRPSRIEAIDDDLVNALRDKSPAERIQMIGAANRTARLLAAAGVRYQHPDWPEEQVNAEVIRRVCGGSA